jgi:hypothetical protein
MTGHSVTSYQKELSLAFLSYIYSYAVKLPSHDDKFLSYCLCIQNITLPSIYIFLLESNTTHIFTVWIWVYLRSSNNLLLKLCVDGLRSQTV